MKPELSFFRLAGLLAGASLTLWALTLAPVIIPIVFRQGWQAAGLALAIEAAQASLVVLHNGFLLGMPAGLSLLIPGRAPGAARAWLGVAACLSLLPLAAWMGIRALAQTMSLPPLGPSVMWPWGAGVILGFAMSFSWLRYGRPIIDQLLHVFRRRSRLERSIRTDVRELHKVLPSEIGGYDPRRHFRPEKGLFVGLDERRRPLYIPWDDWCLSHVLLCGRTRSGKGVAAQILLSQAIARGEFVVILDPKGDEWMPSVFHNAAQAAGRPYQFVDLRPGRPAQLNVFTGCDEETIEAMFIGAFSLAEKGEAADFYRLADRKAAREAARLISKTSTSMTAAQALAAMGETWLDTARGFHAAIEEMADLAAVNATAGGIDIDAMAKTGGCLYIVGDMANSRVVRMQRMLLVRLMMMAKRLQAQGGGYPLITVFADECKVHISRPFMASLGAAAGWGLHVILALQSLQDLADVPADLDAEAVKGAVIENCAIRMSYRIADPDTAEWLSRATGKILVDDEMRTVERNAGLAETVKPERRIRQAERYFIDENMLMGLPRACGVLTLPFGLPKFCYTSPIPVEKRAAAQEVVAAESTADALAVHEVVAAESAAAESATADALAVHDEYV